MSNNSNETLMEKMGNKFFVPLKWSEKVDLNEILEYVINLKMNQISIKNFNNLAIEEATLLIDQRVPSVREIIEERIRMVEWLIKICKKFNLKNETLFKAISLFDYYLSKTTKRKIMRLEEIHFIAVICLNLASKFEEINCNYLIFFKENLLEKGVYEINDLIKMETEILKTLGFRINIPNFYQFNNSLMQIAIHNLFDYYEKAEFKNAEKIKKILNELIKHNEIITKRFALLKESIFSSALNSGIVCFKMTLILLKLNSDIDTRIINDLVDDMFLSKMFKADYIQRCEIVASNLYNVLFSVKVNSEANVKNVNEHANENIYNNYNNNNNNNCNSSRTFEKCQKEESHFANKNLKNAIHSNSLHTQATFN